MKFVERIRNARRRPELIQMAQRIQQMADRGYRIPCARCGGHGPATGIAVLFIATDPYAWCIGCVREEKRSDAVNVRDVPCTLERAPIAVIEA
ncbi:hypothetical protein [Streptomyces sp. NPDC048611]|uniref:hypothetical protein n=1 Tax=Streptomyces sp. NPDC048611 TaxID=3155635 RepID=UPI00343B666F